MDDTILVLSYADDYVADAIRTESPSTPLLLGRVMDSTRCLHGVIGLVTEVGELYESFAATPTARDRVNIKEELGDLTWYMAIIIDTNGFTIADFDVVDIPSVKGHSAINGLMMEVGRLADLLKRHIFYGEALDRSKLKRAIGAVLWMIHAVAQQHGTTIADCMVANIAKLKARYERKKFSEQAALNRDLATERQVLEDKLGK